MEYIHRHVEAVVQNTLKRNKSVLLLGARQTGKTTLINRLKGDLCLSFVRPEVRLRYEKTPSLLGNEVEGLKKTKGGHRPLVLLDEVQKVPDILDAVQDLIDREIANFVLTGSSARKLRHGSRINLLPGRVVALRLDPLTLKELPAASLRERLLYGALPGILRAKKNEDREKDLESYVTIYLEEEVRAEAIVRNVGSFARFLEYAASESGKLVNFRKLSQEIGVAHTTIQSYYEILDDCLIAERIEPLTKSKTRKKLTKSEKYVFFDLGVRRLCAREGSQLPKNTLADLFEQFIGLELIRLSRLSAKKSHVRFWRDPDGPEVDWVIEQEQNYTPIEVKWTDSPTSTDAKHLQTFLSEYENARTGYLICQTPRRLKLAPNILGIPWQEVNTVIEGA